MSFTTRANQTVPHRTVPYGTVQYGINRHGVIPNTVWYLRTSFPLIDFVLIPEYTKYIFHLRTVPRSVRYGAVPYRYGTGSLPVTESYRYGTLKPKP